MSPKNIYSLIIIKRDKFESLCVKISFQGRILMVTNFISILLQERKGKTRSQSNTPNKRDILRTLTYRLLFLFYLSFFHNINSLREAEGSLGVTTYIKMSNLRQEIRQIVVVRNYQLVRFRFVLVKTSEKVSAVSSSSWIKS